MHGPFSSIAATFSTRRFLDRREDDGASSTTLKKDLAGLSMVFRFLNREGLARGNPCDAVKVRANPKRHPAMTEEEYESLRTAMVAEVEDATSPKERRDAQELLDLADLLWRSGLRLVDAARLRWEARFGEGSWEAAYDQEVHYSRAAFVESARRDVNAALGIDPPEDTG